MQQKTVKKLPGSPSAMCFLHTRAVSAGLWIPYSWRDLSTGCLSPEQYWIIPFSLRVLLLLQVTPQRAKGDTFSFWNVSCRQHWPGFTTSKPANSCGVSLLAPSPLGIDEYRKNPTAAHPQTDIMGMNSVSDTGKNPVECDSEISRMPAGSDPASMSVTRGTPLPFTSSSWLPSKQLENCWVEKAHISVKLLLRNRQSTVTSDSQSLMWENKAILQWTT